MLRCEEPRIGSKTSQVLSVKVHDSQRARSHQLAHTPIVQERFRYRSQARFLPKGLDKSSELRLADVKDAENALWVVEAVPLCRSEENRFPPDFVHAEPGPFQVK